VHYPAGWALHFFNNITITCELQQIHQPHSTRKIKIPYSWIANCHRVKIWPPIPYYWKNLKSTVPDNKY
jgi:hypothetical protein